MGMNSVLGLVWEVLRACVEVKQLLILKLFWKGDC